MDDNDQQTETETVEFVNLINHFGREFEDLCVARHDEGQVKYGKFTFLGNDIVRMMAEELADVANYARYQYVKLMLLQKALEEHLEGTGFVAEGQEEVTIGVQAFKGVKDVGWQQP